MSQEKTNGPWGRTPGVDSLTSQDAINVGEAEFIHQTLQGIRQKIVDEAKIRGIKFETKYKVGIPGIATMLEKQGDISTLQDPAKEIVRKENDAPSIKARGIEFEVMYSPKPADGYAALIVTGWTGRKKQA